MLCFERESPPASHYGTVTQTPRSHRQMRLLDSLRLGDDVGNICPFLPAARGHSSCFVRWFISDTAGGFHSQSFSAGTESRGGHLSTLQQGLLVRRSVPYAIAFRRSRSFSVLRFTVRGCFLNPRFDQVHMPRSGSPNRPAFITPCRSLLAPCRLWGFHITAPQPPAGSGSTLCPCRFRW